ncbi:ester cyclase [Spirosoma sp.]|uniref:nuclear transport factor 2 family protein n=1 Tax=Spirosoma sp. TaxID=1899569 RepID=UPI00261421EC|nr:ester cyclase [Spirosoma sp.]MCX6215274.1 nuclear transport factor 2 family protein [Spirosoma sp.]
MQQEQINKSVIHDFYRRAVAQGDIAFAELVIADNYIQHSPALKPGKAGLLEALHLMKQMPKPPATSTPFLRLIAEGDYVVTNLCFGWGGIQKVVVDIFRFENGKVAEHWDAVQDQPEKTLNGNAIMDGPMPIDDPALTTRNKETAQETYQRIFIDHQLHLLPNFVLPDLIQHKPDIADGRNGLSNYLSQKATSVSIDRILLVIAEGDFVVIQSEGTSEGKPAQFYEIFRLSEGKLAEQWGVYRLTQ